MNAVTVNDAKLNLENLIEQVILDVEPTIICTDAGQQIVLMPMDEFNSWQETLYLLSNPANADHLRQSMAQAHVGQATEKELIEAWGWFLQSWPGMITFGFKRMTESS